LQLVFIRAHIVTRVAEPVRNGAGAPISQAKLAPKTPSKIVITVRIKN
jgi:hypothetical protein